MTIETAGFLHAKEYNDTEKLGRQGGADAMWNIEKWNIEKMGGWLPACAGRNS